MDKLIIQGIRCFKARQEVALKPLTILVGENSTGKTTFLACHRIAWDIGYGLAAPDFNEDPFRLGAFEQIAHDSGSGGKVRRTFTVGFELTPRPATPDAKLRKTGKHIRVSAEIGKTDSHPQVTSIRIEADPYSVSIDPDDEAGRFRVTARTAQAATSFSVEILPLPGTAPDIWFYAGLFVHGKFPQKGNGIPRIPELTDQDKKKLLDLMREMSVGLGGRPRALAPIRSRPERTYDPVRDDPRPEGGHIPMVLAREFVSTGKNRNNLRANIERFGKAFGLFDSVDVKYLGKRGIDPFQIYVRATGPTVNLVDVGYGVSQALPILVDTLSAPEGQTFLLQQPEVHLHPRAQAELGTFFGYLVKEQKKRVVVETHSDYLIDRIRMDVRDGVTVTPDDVAILYFERKGAEVKIHNLNLDKHGNIVDAPAGYRQFFMEEERRFFGADACA